ncbi:ATP-dependent helicase [Candidatus Woesearchaeota archaeon CG07_land_8_20_14_0_80_44_23]|nr:MAG: ATP-dependent helicase [Candidatus Woesearchaeota archaeon CG07_land_8_20_14_0_80_44_23]
MIEYKERPESNEELNRILNPLVSQWFFSKFSEFSLPQRMAVMEIHKRKNVLVSAPTGSTKTLTAFLSILNELVDLSQKGLLENKVYCVYISPLKALNYDIEVNLKTPLKEMEELAGKKLGIRVGVRTGDTTASEKAKMLKKVPHILITTPESLGIMLSSIKFSALLKGIDWCVVDEIHALAENKRGVHLSLSMERLQQENYFSRIGLSATIAPIEKIAQFLVGYDNSGKERDCTVINADSIKKMNLKVLSPVPDLIEADYRTMHDKLYELLDQLIQSHKTTLVFTNTRSATERVVFYLKEKFPKNYVLIDETTAPENFPRIGAHHGSLSKAHRFDMEKRLREGRLKCIVCSTSLELGIDIGYIDLVILLGSPKTVARALQRIGRSGHRLSDTTVGRLVVLDRDDLVECSVLLKDALEKKIDRIHIPENCLDVLAQQIVGIAVSEKINIGTLLSMVRRSYCYHNLEEADFREVIEYLAGLYSNLEDRHIYAKIWYDPETGMIGRRGRMMRVIYMTNIGTIPDESSVLVKDGEAVIGKIDEGFLEKLKAGDIFVLGGETYRFKFSRGQVAQVSAAAGKTPTVPSWFSEMLPLSYDLALSIGRFRRLMEEKLDRKAQRKEILDFIHSYLYVDENSAQSIYKYFLEQHLYAEIPNDRKIIIENYKEGEKHFVIFHSLYGRRVNDCLSRAVAFAVARLQHIDVEIGINDNGFYLAAKKHIQGLKALKLLREDKLELVLKMAIDRTEILSRRFRHCAARALMILRNYKGRSQRVGRQQVSSMILINAVKRISPDFCILKEARREVLSDMMDIENAKIVVGGIGNGSIKISEIETKIPSPFALNLVAQGYLDLMKIEERNAFLRRMHRLVVARIGKKNREAEEMFSRKDVEGSGSAGVEPGWTEKANPYERIWAAEEEKKTEELDDADKEAIEKIFGAKEKEEEKEEKKK